MRILLLMVLLSWVATPIQAKTRVGLVLDKGGRDDKSFNASAYQGAKEAEAKLGVQLKVVESSDDAALEPNLRTFAKRGFDLVIGIGFVQLAPIQKVAKEFPKTRFLLVDAHVDIPNVRSVVFKEHEGAYLVGALAALTTQTQKVGFIGGMDIPLIRRFELGFREGIKSINPKVILITNFVGSTSDAWRNPTRGKELALSQFQKGVDITFAAAGASALGAFDATEEMKKFIIGCDSNQNYLKPGRVLSSMIKRVDKAVFDTIDHTTKGTFQGGRLEWGVKEDAIDFALDSYNRSLISPQTEKKLLDIRQKIVSQQIKVTDYYELRSQKAP